MKSACWWAALSLAVAACGGGGGGDSAGGNGALAIERVFPALSFSAVTDVQSQPYPDVAAASGDRLFVVERSGVIRVFDNADGVGSSRVFLDIRDRVTGPPDAEAGGEQGLLGLAFHPDFASNGLFYVHYTVERSDIPQRIRVSRFRVLDQAMQPNAADGSSEQVVLVVDQAMEGPPARNHNGGALAFSPADGFLYIAVGDGGGANDPESNGQDLGTLSGSILRIDVDNAQGGMEYAIPGGDGGNPFVGQDSARGEIFAYGLRNPFKITFDDNGDLWIADVGQSEREEVDLLPAGDNGGPNYGWDCREGSLAGEAPAPACDGKGAGAFVEPVTEYEQSGSQSITGGYVYRGPRLQDLVGRYIYADFISGRLFAYDPGSDSSTELVDTGLMVSSFGRAADGRLYIADFNGGLYRLVNE